MVVEESGEGLGRSLDDVRVGAEGEPLFGHAPEAAERPVGQARQDLDEGALGEARRRGLPLLPLLRSCGSHGGERLRREGRSALVAAAGRQRVVLLCAAMLASFSSSSWRHRAPRRLADQRLEALGSTAAGPGHGRSRVRKSNGAAAASFSAVSLDGLCIWKFGLD